MINKAPYLALLFAAVGCSSSGHRDDPFKTLEVKVLSLQGTIGTQAITPPDAPQADGQRMGNDGIFSVQGPDTFVNATACPLGGVPNSDPYGTGVPGDEPFFFDMASPDDAGEPPIVGIDCLTVGMSVLQGNVWADFPPEQVALRIVDGDDWRDILFSAHGEAGAVELALRYREQR